MNIEKQYIEAFNNGYVLAEHEPRLLNTISKNLNPSNNYLEAFLEGKKQYELENFKSKMTELDRLRSQSQNREKAFGRD